ncbi:uncharacterized protein LOC144085718 [Stigmatopora argus]
MIMHHCQRQLYTSNPIFVQGWTGSGFSSNLALRRFFREHDEPTKQASDKEELIYVDVTAEVGESSAGWIGARRAVAACVHGCVRACVCLLKAGPAINGGSRGAGAYPHVDRSPV